MSYLSCLPISMKTAYLFHRIPLISCFHWWPIYKHKICEMTVNERSMYHKCAAFDHQWICLRWVMINLICKCILDEKVFVRTSWYTLSSALLRSLKIPNVKFFSPKGRSWFTNWIKECSMLSAFRKWRRFLNKQWYVTHSSNVGKLGKANIGL